MHNCLRGARGDRRKHLRLSLCSKLSSFSCSLTKVVLVSLQSGLSLRWVFGDRNGYGYPVPTLPAVTVTRQSSLMPRGSMGDTTRMYQASWSWVARTLDSHASQVTELCGRSYPRRSQFVLHFLKVCFIGQSLLLEPTKTCIHCFNFPKTEMKDVWSQSWIMFVNVSYTWIGSSGMSCKASNPNSAHYNLEAMTTPWWSVRFRCRKCEPETCFLCCGHLDLLALDWLPLDGSGADDR